MDTARVDWERLDRFVTGDGLPAERDALSQWVESDVVLSALARTMRHITHAPSEASPRFDAERAWHFHQQLRRPIKSDTITSDSS